MSASQSIYRYQRARFAQSWDRQQQPTSHSTAAAPPLIDFLFASRQWHSPAHYPALKFEKGGFLLPEIRIVAVCLVSYPLAGGMECGCREHDQNNVKASI